MTAVDKIPLIAAIAAGVSAVVAMAALFVALFARRDSKRSADAAEKSASEAKRSNDLATAEHLRRVQRELSDSRPSFIWFGGSSRAGIFLEYTKEFKNVGSEIKDLLFESGSSDVSVIANPLVYFPNNASSVMTFKSNSSKKLVPFNFSITGTTKLGDRYKELFQAKPEWSDMKISLVEQISPK
jgi:hypothetical protein